jgi:hypothetical protein
LDLEYSRSPTHKITASRARAARLVPDIAFLPPKPPAEGCRPSVIYTSYLYRELSANSPTTTASSTIHLHLDCILPTHTHTDRGSSPSHPSGLSRHAPPTMPSILLTVFILQLVIHIVNTLGASTINNLVLLIPPSPPFPGKANPFSYGPSTHPSRPRKPQPSNAS